CRVALKYPHHRCAKLIESMLANEAGASRRVSVARCPLGDYAFHLLLDCLEVEGCAFLHRREVYCRLGQLSDLLLHVDEAPEFTRIEIVEVARRAFEHIRHRQPLERILLDVLKDRHVDGNLRPRPTLRLVDEAILELIETKAAEIGFGEVPDLMPPRRSFPCQQVSLIVAIEMHLVGRAA